jgi:thiamine-phosphate pyrophosphorylase
MADAPRRLPLSRKLYLVLDPAFPAAGDLHNLTQSALAAGVQMFQVRMKTAPTGEFYTNAAGLYPRIKAAAGRFIINDRCDVALAVGADGVHLGQEDLPLAEARRMLGPDKIIGISTHTVAQALEAQEGGADYIGLGPIYATRSKIDPHPCVGLAGLREVRARVRLPIVAIGGISLVNVADVLAAGADYVAALSAILAAQNPDAAMRAMLKLTAPG